MTLVEMMIATSTFTMMMAGFFLVYLFGFKMYSVAEAKTGASDDARISLSRMANEVRSAWLVKVGDGGLTSFQEKQFGQVQRGSAIQIYPTSNTNQWVRYYLDTIDYTLKRKTHSDSAALLMAHSIASQSIFTSEDFQGNVLTNNYNNRVIGLKLQIKQFQYPITKVGAGQLFDFYEINTKFTRRKLE